MTEPQPPKVFQFFAEHRVGEEDNRIVEGNSLCVDVSCLVVTTNPLYEATFQTSNFIMISSALGHTGVDHLVLCSRQIRPVRFFVLFVK